MTIIYTKPCIHCNLISTIEASDEQYAEYIEGIKYIQDVFPEKSADERELLISGTHPKCWDEMFPDED